MNTGSYCLSPSKVMELIVKFFEAHPENGLLGELLVGLYPGYLIEMLTTRLEGCQCLNSSHFFHYHMYSWRNSTSFVENGGFFMQRQAPT